MTKKSTVNKKEVQNGNAKESATKNSSLWYQGEVVGKDNDKKRYQMWLIKQELILNPNVSCRDVGEKLKITKDSANKYMNKVRRQIVKEREERVQRLHLNTVEQELTKMEDEVAALTIQLFEIIKTSWRSRDKISAIRVLFNAKERLFNLKFDAGLFKRDLGKMEFVDVHNLVKKIYDESRGNSSTERSKL